jgi:predicted transcriptional regulator
MSIHPQYADAILRGDKTVEFRKRGFSHPVSHVLIYATAPRKLVLGYFVVDAIESGKPETLWRRHGRSGCIRKTDFGEYYRGVAKGVAIRVQDAVRFRAPLQLSALGVRTAPQSYRYVDFNVAGASSRRGTR